LGVQPFHDRVEQLFAISETFVPRVDEQRPDIACLSDADCEGDNIVAVFYNPAAPRALDCLCHIALRDGP